MVNPEHYVEEIVWSLNPDKVSALMRKLLRFKLLNEWSNYVEEGVPAVFKIPDAKPIMDVFVDVFPGYDVFKVYTKRGEKEVAIDWCGRRPRSNEIMVFDTILATGGTILRIVEDVGARDFKVFSLIGSKEGEERIRNHGGKVHVIYGGLGMRAFGKLRFLWEKFKLNSIPVWPYVCDFGDRLRGDYYESDPNYDEERIEETLNQYLGYRESGQLLVLEDMQYIRTYYGKVRRLLTVNIIGLIIYEYYRAALQYNLRYRLNAERLYAYTYSLCFFDRGMKVLLKFKVDDRLRSGGGYFDNMLVYMRENGMIEENRGRIYLTKIWRRYISHSRRKLMERLPLLQNLSDFIGKSARCNWTPKRIVREATSW